MSVKRFGFMAVEMGFITLDQIIEAMKIQVREDLEKPKHRLIGEILVDLGFMNPSQVDEVLKAMGISS
ncbi:MAG: hypothetical protein JRI52_09975 [Deltaproteobacteria bacterium]|nr:hypothetical protein [Deltaproteobacteria bacterium]